MIVHTSWIVAQQLVLAVFSILAKRGRQNPAKQDRITKITDFQFFRLVVYSPNISFLSILPASQNETTPSALRSRQSNRGIPMKKYFLQWKQQYEVILLLKFVRCSLFFDLVEFQSVFRVVLVQRIIYFTHNFRLSSLEVFLAFEC